MTEKAFRIFRARSIHLKMIRFFVVAGLVPAIHVFLA
jgi:hypothetical protein